MDAFYASVEVLLDPSLAGRPVIVGGDGARGVVASCSYEARAYGIRSAMPSTEARRRCPHAVFIGGRHGLYGEYSARLHEVLARTSPLVEGIALDEAFVDVTGGARLLGNGAAVAAALRAEVRAALGLTCSIGVASSKLIAKLASKAAKPRPGRPGRPNAPIPPLPPVELAGATRPSEAVVDVAAGDELCFLHPHPVQALWGVGPATLARLARFGVATVGDLAGLSEETLVRALGRAHGQHLHALARADDPRPVQPDQALKSVGHEETYARDHHAAATLGPEVIRQADAVAARLRAAGVAGRTVSLKLKFADFRTVTRARTFAEPVDTAGVIAATVRALLDVPALADEVAERGVRLLGVSVHNLVAAGDARAAAAQLSLFDSGAPASGVDGTSGQSASAESPAPDPARAADIAVDAREPVLARVTDEIRARFGDGALGPAVLVDPQQGLRVKRRGDTAWGPSGDG